MTPRTIDAQSWLQRVALPAMAAALVAGGGRMILPGILGAMFGVSAVVLAFLAALAFLLMIPRRPARGRWRGTVPGAFALPLLLLSASLAVGMVPDRGPPPHPLTGSIIAAVLTGPIVVTGLALAILGHARAQSASLFLGRVLAAVNYVVASTAAFTLAWAQPDAPSLAWWDFLLRGYGFVGIVLAAAAVAAFLQGLVIVRPRARPTPHSDKEISLAIDEEVRNTLKGPPPR